MNNLHHSIHDFVAKLGFDPSLSGCIYFVYIIEIYITETQSFSLYKACEQIAQAYNSTRTAVQRALYYAIGNICNITDKLLRLFDVYIDPIDFHPKQLICIVANHILYGLNNFVG